MSPRISLKDQAAALADYLANDVESNSSSTPPQTSGSLDARDPSNDESTKLLETLEGVRFSRQLAENEGLPSVSAAIEQFERRTRGVQRQGTAQNPAMGQRQGLHSRGSRSLFRSSGTSTSGFGVEWYSRPLWAALGGVCLLAVLMTVRDLHQPWSGDRNTEIVSMREYVTNPGHRATISLPDGSIVQLNVGSRLRVPAQFGKDSRDVYLDGEAQFSVQPRVKLPFIVRTGNSIVRELGTVFSVRSYANEGRTEVAVAEGRVSVAPLVSTTPQTTTLSQSDAAVLSFDGTIKTLRGTDISPYMGWTNGHLVFHSAPVAEVLVHLGRWYNLEFRITDTSLIHRRVDLAISDQQWSPDVLSILAQALSVRAERVGRVVRLTPEE